MSRSTPNDTDPTDRQHSNQGLPARARRLASRIAGGNRRGTLAVLAGGVLLARAKRTGGRLRTALSGLAGITLVAYGVRQRISGSGRRGGGGGPAAREHPDDRTGETDEEGGPTEAMRHESHTGTNPRDVDQEPDVETETDPDEGRVEFSTDQDPGPHEEPHLEGEEGDPRQEGDEAVGGTDDGDEPVEVDISEAAMADEPNEAAGPSSTQAFPSQVEDTEPDSSPATDASHVEADEPATEASEGESEDESDADGAGDEDPSDDVSTGERYEGERGDDGTVDADDEDTGEQGDE